MASAWCWAGMCVCVTGPFSLAWIPHTGLHLSVYPSVWVEWAASDLPDSNWGCSVVGGPHRAQTVLSAPS